MESERCPTFGSMRSSATIALSTSERDDSAVISGRTRPISALTSVVVSAVGFGASAGAAAAGAVDAGDGEPAGAAGSREADVAWVSTTFTAPLATGVDFGRAAGAAGCCATERGARDAVTGAAGLDTGELSSGVAAAAACWRIESAVGLALSGTGRLYGATPDGSPERIAFTAYRAPDPTTTTAAAAIIQGGLRARRGAGSISVVATRSFTRVGGTTSASWISGTVDGTAPCTVESARSNAFANSITEPKRSAGFGLSARLMTSCSCFGHATSARSVRRGIGSVNSRDVSDSTPVVAAKGSFPVSIFTATRASAYWS